MSFEDVTVRFVGYPPSEEIVHFVRRCAKERWIMGPLTVVVKATDLCNREHEIRIEESGGRGIRERGSDVLAAVRDAFDRFEIESSSFQA